MTSINDLLSNLTQQNPISPRDRPDTWRLHFIVPSAVRLWRDDRALLEALVQEGFVVHVIAHDDGAFELMNASGVHTCALPACDALTRGLLLAPAIFPIIQGHLIEHPPTLIHVEHEPLLLITLAATRMLSERPLVVGTLRGYDAPTSTLRDLLPAKLAAPLDSLNALYWSHLDAHLDVFLTTSRDELEGLMAHTPIRGKRLEVWAGASGYDHAHFDPARRDLPSRQELRTMAEVPASWHHIVGVAGDFYEDATLLATTIQALAHDHPHVGWVLAKLPGMEPPAALAALAAHIIWLEPGEQGMPLFVSLCDLFFSPRRTARTSTSLVEAHAMGIPCVAFATRHHATVILDRQTGSLMPLRRDARPLQAGREAAAALGALLQDSSIREEMSAHASTRALLKFTRHAAHDQLMRLYDRLLSRRYATSL